MPAFQIFSGALGTDFQPSKIFVLELDKIVLDLELTVTTPGVVEWYLEFADAEAIAGGTKFYRETSNESGANGAVTNAAATRTLRPSGGGSFAAGTHRLSVEVVRRHQLTRAQFRAPAPGAISLVALSAFGIGPFVLPP